MLPFVCNVIHLIVSIHAPAGGATVSGMPFWTPANGFNPRTRGGCDRIRVTSSWTSLRFQSTHPRGVRLLQLLATKHLGQFQSTHPRGVRLIWFLLILFSSRFQSTHPRGVRLHDSTRLFRYMWFQSTHPRGVRPVSVCVAWPPAIVSIHAPAGGATQRAHGDDGFSTVSIHAPAGGATLKPCIMPFHMYRFQSTHPRGVRQDPEVLINLASMLFQSTHPRGVRRTPRYGQRIRHHGFNPRTRGGCDISVGGGAIADRLFQSTHPRGVRPHKKAEDAIQTQGFNPRTRGGCDPTCVATAHGRASVSIHAPAGGATPRACLLRPGTHVSIHAPAGGATTVSVLCHRWLLVSIHAPAGGATGYLDNTFLQIMFQSTHPRGVRRLPYLSS